MNDKPPPLIRRREIQKYYRVKLPDEQLAKWEESGVIHPFRSDPASRAWYYTSELDQILNGPQTT